jgi:hypothetical protein
MCTLLARMKRMDGAHAYGVHVSLSRLIRRAYERVHTTLANMHTYVLKKYAGSLASVSHLIGRAGKRDSELDDSCICTCKLSVCTVVRDFKSSNDCFQAAKAIFSASTTGKIKQMHSVPQSRCATGSIHVTHGASSSVLYYSLGLDSFRLSRPGVETGLRPCPSALTAIRTSGTL